MCQRNVSHMFYTFHGIDMKKKCLFLFDFVDEKKTHQIFITRMLSSLFSFHRTLNNNNITALPREIFSGMPRIRALRLSDNPFTCDCHLSWLSRYLRNSPRLAPYTRCHSPSQLKGQSLSELHEHDFKCSGKNVMIKMYAMRNSSSYLNSSNI